MLPGERDVDLPALLDVPVLVLAAVDEHADPVEEVVEAEEVAVRGVADVVAVLLEELGERGVEAEVLPEALVVAVRAIERDLHRHARRHLPRAVGVEALVPVGVVGLVGVEAGLEEDLGGARVANDERREAAEAISARDLHRVQPARPLGGDRDRERVGPLALDPPGAGVERTGRLLHRLVGAAAPDLPGPGAAVVADPVELDGDVGRVLRRDLHLDGVAGGERVDRGVELDLSAVRVAPAAPVAVSRPRVLGGDRVRRGDAGERRAGAGRAVRRAQLAVAMARIGVTRVIVRRRVGRGAIALAIVDAHGRAVLAARSPQPHHQRRRQNPPEHAHALPARTDMHRAEGRQAGERRNRRDRGAG